MRNILIQKRLKANMTVEQVAEHLGISTLRYKLIEKGTFMGSYEIWDHLEVLLNESQYFLRQDEDYTMLDRVWILVVKLWIAAAIFKVGVDIWVACH